MTTNLFSRTMRDRAELSPRWGRAQQARAESALHILQDCGEHVGDVVAHADIEDFWEDVFRASSALTASGGDIAFVDAPRAWTASEWERRLGPVPFLETGGHERDVFAACDVVKKWGRRPIDTVTSSLEENEREDDLVRWMLSARKSGVDAVVIKTTETKMGWWRILLSPSDDEDSLRQKIFEELDWTAVRLDGVPSAFTVQNFVDMSWEYRLFVVDNVVVAGSGCVEENTPADHVVDSPFDPVVRENRHLRTPLETRVDIVSDLVDFGRELVADGGVGTAVVDVAVGRDLQPQVVELNALPNSGLYALDVDAVASALVTADSRGYEGYIRGQSLRS